MQPQEIYIDHDASRSEGEREMLIVSDAVQTGVLCGHHVDTTIS